MNAFLHMGGYAVFVWPAYAAVILVVVILGIHSWRSEKMLAAEAGRLKQAAAGARPAAVDEEQG